MSDQDVFETETQATPDTQEAPAQQEQTPQDAFADKLSAITNEDGSPKYSDVVQALDSIPHAQKHISTIEEENAALKAELAKAQAAKEILEKAGSTNQQTESLTPEEVAKIAQQTLQKQAEASQKEANVKAVNAKFSELYGNKANEQMRTIATEAGITVDAVKELAEKSPNAVFRLAGINAQSKLPGKTPGAGVGDNFQPSQRDIPQPKSVMNGASTGQMVDAWRQAGEIVRNR